MEPPFRAHAQQNGGPVIPPAVVTRSAPTQPANNRSFIHSNPRASNPSIPAPTNDPSHTNSRGRRGPFQKTAPSTNRGRSSAPSNAPAPPSSSDGILSLRAIGPVKEALALFRDGSPIMVALERTIRQTSNPAPLNSSQRDRILDFKGFSVYSNPTYSWLCALSKNDLDILAWVFVVSKHGRKEEVAKRIIAALRAPLKHKSPALAKRPSIPARMGARSLPPNMSHTASTTTNTRTVPSRSNHTANSRGSMPSLVPAPSNSRASRPEFSPLLQTLQQNLCTWRQTNTTSMPAPCPPLPTPQQNRNKQMQLLCHELLQGYDFDVGENPFNTPLNRPLGVEQHFVFFNSMQLSRGNCDPVLKFFTPPPIDPKVRPIIKGGDVQIHIRCLIVDANKPKTEWRQAWPFPATCRVNGHNVTLNQAQRYTNGKLAGRDAATNITPCLRKYKSSGSSEKNRVTLKRQVSNATAATGQYVLFAQEVLVLSHKTMTKRVVESSEKYWVEHRKSLEVQGTISPISTKFEMAQQGVVQFLRDSDGLSVSCMKVSLRCPLALTRISIPVKGKRCHHVQCFDLDNFLEYARRSSKFECPVCNKATCDPSALVISPYIEHALDKFKDCDEVEIFQDGSMVKVERKHTGVASDDENEDDVKGKANGRLNKAHAPSRAPNMDVVDLTLDSDDDLNLPVPNPTRSPPNDNEGTSDGCIEGIKNDEIGKGDGINEGNVTPTREDPHALQPFGTDIQAIDQDVDFSFRADFGNWGDGTSQGADDPTHGSRQYQTSNQREGWACDVIAIDSD